MMKKLLMILLALLAAACITAMPFLLSHSSILPEVSTAYYEQKAQEEAMNATGPEAELMRLLLGGAAAPAVKAEPTKPAFSGFGLWLAIGVVFALILLFLQGRKQPELRTALFWAGVLSVPLGLFGARLIYCVVNLTFYLNDIAAPEAMLKVWEGGLSLAGALVFAVLAGVCGARIARSSAGKTLDAMTLPLLALCFWTSLGCDHFGIGFGPEVGFSLGGLTAVFGETLRLNTSVLTASAMLALYLLHLHLQSRQARKGAARPDVTFALMVFLYGTVMILLESLRRDGHMVWGFVHAEMVFDLVFALPALLYLAKTKKRLLLCTLATAALAGVVIALEFALDRSSIGDAWLYLAYIAVIAAYIGLGCICAKKRAAE